MSRMGAQKPKATTTAKRAAPNKTSRAKQARCPRGGKAASSRPQRRERSRAAKTFDLRAQMTIHFRLPHRAMLGDVEAAWTGVVDWLGRDRFNWLQQSQTRLYGALSSTAWARLARRFAPSGRDSVWIDIKGVDPARGAAGANDVAEVGVRLAAHPRGSWHYADTLGVLQVIAPVERMVDDPRGWRDRFLALCAQLPPFTAIAGHVLATCDLTVRLDDRPRFLEQLNAVVGPQPGIDLALDDPRVLLSTKSLHWVGWLTALSGAQLQRLGGLARLRRQLAREIEIVPLADGAVLQAGPRPATGENGRPPAAYASVWRAVRPVLAPYRVPPAP